MERHRAQLADAAIEEQIEVQTAFREQGQRLQRIYDHRWVQRARLLVACGRCSRGLDNNNLQNTAAVGEVWAGGARQRRRSRHLQQQWRGRAMSAQHGMAWYRTACHSVHVRNALAPPCPPAGARRSWPWRGGSRR